MSETEPARRAGWVHHPRLAVAEPLDFAVQIGAASGRPIVLNLVYSDDGLYVPALACTPPGPGPFPTVVCLHGGSGGLGIAHLADEMLNRGWVFERLLAEGYAVVWTEGRAEIEDAYGTDIPACLDHQDVIAVWRWLLRQPFADPSRIGFFGVSHGGELQMKLIAEIGRGPAALVPTEPAVIEFLGLRYSGERKEANLQFRGQVGDETIDLARAMARIERIDPDLPILVIGRDDDHLQGGFRKLHELLARAGKRVEWLSFDHPEHAYQFGPRRSGAGYSPDPVQVATLEAVVAFLNRAVRDRGRAGP